MMNFLYHLSLSFYKFNSSLLLEYGPKSWLSLTSRCFSSVSVHKGCNVEIWCMEGFYAHPVVIVVIS